MKIRESVSLAWGAMILVVLLIIIAACTRVVSSVWEYLPLFCAFMGVFCHLASLMLLKMSRDASRKLDVAAAVFGVLTVLALIVIFILDWCDFY